MNEPQPQKKKSGCGCCLGTGCLVLVIIAALVIGGGIWGYGRFVEYARPYTASSGEQIPITGTSQQYDAVVKRMDAFKNAAPGSNATLSLSANDLNVLIACSPQWSGARGKITVSIADGNVNLAGSLPLTILPRLRDRYLNGTLVLTPSIENKVFHVNIQDIILKPRALPKETIQRVAAESDSNLVNRLLGDPVIGPILTNSESMKVTGDTLVFIRAN